MRILVADDDASIRRFAVRALERMGHAVVTADGGMELIRLACVGRPDLIVSDIEMPHCDGIRACRLLRDALPETSFILMTGNPDRAAAAEEAGFQLVLRKPFDLSDLMQGVEEARA